MSLIKQKYLSTCLSVLRAVTPETDVNHVYRLLKKIHLPGGIHMIFSKSFGYAVRGVLYIALVQDEKHYVQVEEIAANLAAPRHFMGKILKKLAKEGVLSSTKGPSGGFTINKDTLSLSLIRIMQITDGLSPLQNCVLRMTECHASNPCPMHRRMEMIKSGLLAVLSDTSIGDLLNNDKTGFLKSISIHTELSFLPAEK
jgi:Rrf2 family iron-sulfur cluster assembly transcriptional regulator